VTAAQSIDTYLCDAVSLSCRNRSHCSSRTNWDTSVGVIRGRNPGEARGSDSNVFSGP
jgi:hypothetical protein